MSWKRSTRLRRLKHDQSKVAIAPGRVGRFVFCLGHQADIGAWPLYSNCFTAGVPFYIRTEKRFARNLTEIRVHLKSTPQALFASTSSVLNPNVITISIQPDEGTSIAFDAKRPGTQMRTVSGQLLLSSELWAVVEGVMPSSAAPLGRFGAQDACPRCISRLSAHSLCVRHGNGSKHGLFVKPCPGWLKV